MHSSFALFQHFVQHTQVKMSQGLFTSFYISTKYRRGEVNNKLNKICTPNAPVNFSRCASFVYNKMCDVTPRAETTIECIDPNLISKKKKKGKNEINIIINKSRKNKLYIEADVVLYQQ